MCYNIVGGGVAPPGKVVEMVLRREDAERFAKRGSKVEIRKALRKAGYAVRDESWQGYMNLYVDNDDGTATRIYRSHRDGIKVQVWTPVKFKWSGIPTFCPSGNYSGLIGRKEVG